jgi:hypothetical protein
MPDEASLSSFDLRGIVFPVILFFLEHKREQYESAYLVEYLCENVQLAKA